MNSYQEPFVIPKLDQVPHLDQVPDLATNSILHIHDWMSIFPKLSVGFTTRNGGVSDTPFQHFNISLRIGDREEHVLHNRKKLSHDVGFDFAAWTCAEQVHGTQVTHITSRDRGAGQLTTHTEVQKSDALLTNQPDIMLVSFYADCVPLYFWDNVHQVVGLAHAGWKGTYGQIASQVLDEMNSAYGTSPSEVHCAIGPSIGSCCYEVREDLIDQFTSRFGHMEQFVNREHEKPRLDLKQINKKILLECGVREQHILVSSYCTHCREDLFFSHRRDDGRTGRMVSWIGLKNN